MFHHDVTAESARKPDKRPASPRKKVEHKLAGVLSLDTAGPLKPAYDHGILSRNFLIGTFTWVVPLSIEETPPAADEPKEDEPQGEWPEIEEKGEEEEEEEQRFGGLTDAEKDAGEDLYPRLQEPHEEKDQDDEKIHEGNYAEAEEVPKDFRIEVYRVALPMHSKKSREVTRTTMEMITKLRMDGFSVNQIHADQGHEFAGHFADWCSRRGTLLTKTAGDEPQSNGRAENAVKVVKNMVRKILRNAGEDSKWWPWAVRYCNELSLSHEASS